MTEYLADGPDCISDSDFMLAFHFSPLWTNGAALRSMNSIDASLEDKELGMTHLDLQKRFPIYHVCPQMLGGPSLRSAIRKNVSTFLNVGISNAN